MDIQEQVKAAVKSVAEKKIPADPEESLFESGALDSFALPDLVTALEAAFGIKIPDSDLNPRKFDSIARISEYIEGKL